ncbi:hypothetical protein EOD41_11560 [Mucilaginibacter limnophilus]|uniref:Lipoprotein n=1 Tax=Mucilaginibacter limnophilus TaxID=1932778 RepID=A0A3S2VM99_9SPHI|nr:hypothetical protein [Mucilaginibacter limnophilus]RVU00631.1 hypothetical protein EOD41_11560 [Mucilaginibacter limnophilus]
MKNPILILLMLVSAAAVTGCKKSHEFIYAPSTPIEKDTVLVKLLRVETTKGTDRDGDYYTDRFYLETKKDLKFIKAGHQAVPAAELSKNIVFEDSVDGPILTLMRREKNASYELETVWSVPETRDNYIFKCQFKAVNEQ